MKTISSMLVIALVSLTTLLQAQTDMEKIFDEGHNKRIGIKFNTIDALNGDFNLSLEVKPFKRISFELVGGKILSNFLYEIDVENGSPKDELAGTTGGLSYGFRLKGYVERNIDLSGAYIAYAFHRRKYDFENGEELFYRSYGVHYGYQLMIPKTPFIIDLSTGFYLRFKKGNQVSFIDNTGYIIPIDVKVGVNF